MKSRTKMVIAVVQPLAPWQLCNAIACLSLALADHAPKNGGPATGTRFPDLGLLPDFPVLILKAEDSAHLHRLHEDARHSSLPVVRFPRRAFEFYNADLLRFLDGGSEPMDLTAIASIGSPEACDAVYRDLPLLR